MGDIPTRTVTAQEIYDLRRDFAEERAKRLKLVAMLDKVVKQGCRIARAENVMNDNGFVVVPHEETMEEARALLEEMQAETT